MNKHLHRIVFNASRGLRMVVQETARSTGRGARKATSGGAGASSAAVSVAAIAAALMSAPLHAQIVADPNAPGNQRPTVLVAPNGVPLVNIQTPSAAGVSRNTYSQFDVQRNGAILNNSRGNAQTQLGGWVQGNPWLATGSARVILNEVNSANPSQLRGYVEVAGPRTEVIIANPAGIQVQGGGFINVNRATLTTGTPQFNAQGGLDSFVVRGGSVRIDGAGLDASKTDYAAILARAVQVNAGIWANELKVVAGANQVSADSSQATPAAGNGPAPSFALDVAALGGMYAGKITLVGTEAGVGVRNAGHIGAGGGGLVVTASGRLENTGTLEGAKVELRSASDIDNRGGTIRQAGTRDISITAPVLSNTNRGVIGAEPVAAMDPASGTPSTDTGATGTTTGAAPTSTTTTETSTTTAGIAEATPLQPAAATGPGAIVAAGNLLNDGGHIYAGGEIALNTPRIDNTGGALSVGTMAVTGDRFSNAGGTLNVSRDFSADVGSFDNSGGTLQAGALRIQAAGELNNTAGTIVGNEAVQITAGGLTNDGGKIHAAGSADLTLSVNALLTNRSKGEIGAGGNTTINAGVLDNDAGRITAVGDLRVTALGAASNRAGTLAANRNAALDAASFDNSGGSVDAVGGDLTVNTAGATVNRGGKLQASGAILLVNGGLDNTDGQVIGGRAVIDTNGNALTNTRGTLAATATTVDIQSGALNNTAGLIQSKAALTIDTHGQALTNVDAASYADGEGGITSADAITLRTGAVDNRAGFVGAAAALRASTGEFINRDGGVVVSRADVDIDTRGALYDNRGGQTLAARDLAISAGRIDNGAGLIRSGEATTLHASSVDNANTQGADQGIEARTLRLNADTLTNTRGAIRTNADATIVSAGIVDNTAGLISAMGALRISDPKAGTATAKALDIVNTDGTLAAGERLLLDAAGFSGDGTVVSDKELAIALSKNVVNNGAVSAAGTLSYVTTGTFTNNSKLHATQTLSVGGADVLNNVGAEMSAGQKTVVTASGTLTNRGLIDGVDTQVNAGTLDNLGTGRIYGDRISLLADGTLNNGAETVNGVTSAASIAARDTLHIGAKVINNSGHAQIFSVGDAAIGGTLDGNRQAMGQAATLTNSAATLDIGGNLRLAVDQVNNLNPTIRTEQVAGPTQHFLEYAPAGSNDRLSGGTYDRRSSSKSQTYAYYTTKEGQTIQAKEWYIWDYDRNTAITQVVAGSSDPGQILVGGDLNYSGNALRNQASKIVIGGALTGNTGALSNEGLDGVETTTDHGTVTYSYTERRWYSGSRRDRRFEDVESYDPAVPDRTFTLKEFTYEQGLKPVSGQGPDGLALGNVNANTAAAGQVSGGNRAGVITEVATGVDGVVRTSQTGNASVPTASLFRTTATGHYLIETDPRFASYRNWLSSDYLLDALGQDPNNILKRLGDGFYEQKLIREQIAQLTGYRYLDGFESDETQYTALMNAGVTFAKAYGLRPGIGLSAAQMAQLTSDIVWLVEQTVTLADGSTQRVLAPQVYVRVKPGDIDDGGALLSANALHITSAPGTGNVTNTGTLAGRTLVAITADNVDNLGGRIVGGNVGLAARNDLNNIGGSIEARDAAVLTAGRDINIRTTTSTQTSSQGSRTNIDRVAGVYVTNPGGTLIASAGNDVNIVGAILSSAGTVGVGAGRDINLGTVTTARSEDITWDAKNYRRSSESQDVGSHIAGGDVTLLAGNDVSARAATVAADGALSVAAGRHVTIEAGRSTQSLDEASYTKSSDMLSSTATTRRDSYRSDTAAGSSFGGKSVAVSAGKDIRVTGSEVIADERLALAAANNIAIEASTQTASESHFLDEKKSGVFGSGGIGFTIGSQQQSTDQQTCATHAAASTVGSVGGDVVIVAGNAYRQTGSDVLAPAGDVTILAKKVDIVEARETSRTDTEQKQRTGGLTIAITAPIVSAVQSLGGTARAVADTGSQRMKALGAASMALEAKGVADAVMQSPSQAMGVNLAISIGGSKSQSNRVETSDSARGSSVAAGGNVTIAALGGGQDSNLLIRGSDINAGKEAVLMADNRIDILAAENDWAQHSTNKASAASIGVSFGTSGFLVNASASASKGKSDGTETSYTNSHVNAGERVTLVSGGDTTIRGGVITAETVRADIGGNLTIESLQDRAKSDSKQQSAGGSLSVGAGVWSASASMSSAKAKGDYASVTEQSGIKVGDGGFDVNVKGNTDLRGGIISSTQAAIDAGKNSFQTASLTTSDIVNRDTYKASGTTLGAGLSGGSDKNGNALPTRTGGSAGAGQASGRETSVTRSGISGIAGDETVRTGTDTTHALTKTWNTDTLVKDVQAQAQITQGFGAKASKAVGDYAGGKAAELRREGKEEEAKAWDEGGANRSLAHALIGGLTGGVQGAAGAAFAALAAPTISDLTKDLPDAVKGAVGAGLAAGLGAAVGGSGGATAGFNEDLNNRQLHYAEKDRIRSTANGDKTKEERLTQAACYAVKCWAQYPEGSELYKANYVSALDASGLSSELAWVANEKKMGLFEYTAFQGGTDAIAATTGMATGTLNGQPVSSLTGNRPSCGQSADCAAGLTNTGPARNSLNGTFGLGYYNGIGGEMEVEFVNGEPVGGKVGVGAGYGVHLTRQAASGGVMQSGVGGYKSPAIWESNPQLPGEIRIGSSLTWGGGIGTTGLEGSIGGGISRTDAGANTYLQSGVSFTASPVTPKFGSEIKINVIEFSVKPPSGVKR